MSPSRVSSRGRGFKHGGAGTAVPERRQVPVTSLSEGSWPERSTYAGA